MNETPQGLLRIDHFSFDPDEHQLAPTDRVAASYMITNDSGHVELSDIVLTHAGRTDNDDHPILTIEPATVRIEGPLKPHDTRSVSLTVVTSNHLPGRHPLKVEARFTCQPVKPESVAVFDFVVAAD